MTQQKSAIGILVSEPAEDLPMDAGAPERMPENSFCRDLCRLGRELGLLVYVFWASSAQAASGTIQGFVHRQGKWNAQDCPLPDFIYDRTLCKSTSDRRIRSAVLSTLKENHPFILLNGALPGKWDVYEAMYCDELLRPLLPPTYRYEGIESLSEIMRSHQSGLFLKPAAGYQGRGAFRLERISEGCRIDGRSGSNMPLHKSFGHMNDFTLWFDQIAHSAAYIIQPYLQLTDLDGYAYDIRSLIQKDERGRWNMTGSALRLGETGSVTANLHGGGSAHDAFNGLSKRFGADQARELLIRMKRISERAAVLLEQRFGRLCELGLDYGIEPDGRLWLLEANAKPGRQSFQENPETARNAVLRPLQYALLLANSRTPLFQSTVQTSVAARSR
ncbi:YheC/YheD family endospore coat-associated protein [Paenibacillus mendelii]|uniref:YheC/YheD family protein n=1 Tax=Paenibacillus mendelii TaxID=206163 RepID=A0ABV6JBE6_9BACL|nr:YheC/YheD family protein [Paenibacillus mendelii]MCQ6558565.1 YheC/YheD family protein [Paenibacillus mendelii]